MNVYFMVVDFKPRIALTTGPWNHSFHALMHMKECVPAIPTTDLAEKVIGIAACSGSGTDKFKRFELTPQPSAKIKAPLIAECLACLECRVTDYWKPHGIFLLEGVRAWIDPERKARRTLHAIGDGTLSVDGETISLRGLMADKLPPDV